MVLMFAAGATGVMLGLWFRVQALIAASALTVLAWLLIAAFTEFDLLATAGTLLLLTELAPGRISGGADGGACVVASRPCTLRV